MLASKLSDRQYYDYIRNNELEETYNNDVVMLRIEPDGTMITENISVNSLFHVMNYPCATNTVFDNVGIMYDDDPSDFAEPNHFSAKLQRSQCYDNGPVYLFATDFDDWYGVHDLDDATISKIIDLLV